jgi:hypothetical protein
MDNSKPKRFIPQNINSPKFKSVRNPKSHDVNEVADTGFKKEIKFIAVKSSQSEEQDYSDNSNIKHIESPRKFKPAKNSKSQVSIHIADNAPQKKIKSKTITSRTSQPNLKQPGHVGIAVKREDLMNSVPLIPNSEISIKNGTTTLLLCFFFGIWGFHRFYTGYRGLGILYFFTLGLLGWGWLIDLISIIRGTYRDTNKKLVKL